MVNNIDEIKSENVKFNAKVINKLLVEESRFIENLLTIAGVPSIDDIPESSSEEEGDDENDKSEQPELNKVSKEKTRARSLTELQERLTHIQSKKKLNIKDKLMKKGLKGKLRKATKRNERNIKHKLIRLQKTAKVDNGTEIKHEIQTEENKDQSTQRASKPIYNREGKMVFSKFDFSGLGHKPEKKPESDPKKILKNLEKQKAKLEALETQGEAKKASDLKLKEVWKNVVAKAEGKKVKDDPALLKKSIKKREQKKKSSEKKWKTRTETVQKQMEAKQSKRNDNLAKRKKDKKTKKMKHAAKRGRIVPGF